MNRQFVLSWVVCGILSSVSMAADRKPNFLIFLSDDVGWAEYGFQGGKDIPTPNIDSIATNGIRCPQGYVSGPYCSPTRAGLMTGRYQTRFGHEFNSAANAGLALSETTFPNRLKTLGYATCAVGKWHLGAKNGFQPTQRGFDEYFGTLGNTPYYHATQFVDSRESTQPRKIPDEDFYTTDAYAARSVDWIEKHKAEPWFLYLPFNAQHAPLQAPQKYLDRFKQITDENRRKFAAVMSAMDDAVGQVLAKVREINQEEDTFIVFFSDNGGPTKQTTSNNEPLRGFKATTWEGGVRVPFCMQWKGHLPAGKTYDKPIIQLDLQPTMLAAAGAEIKQDWKLDGVNLLPYLKGEIADAPHESLYWRFGEQWAIRHGDWKLVAGRGQKTAGLYHLTEDIAESKNLIAENPDKAKELQALWDQWNAEQAPPSSAQENPNANPANPNQTGNRRRQRRLQKAQQN